MVKAIRNYGRVNAVKKMFTHLESESVQDFLLNFIFKLIHSGEKTLIGQQISFIQFIQKVCATPVYKWPSSLDILQEKVYILSLFTRILYKLYEKLTTVGTDSSSLEVK